MAKMMKTFKTIREENENIMKLKGVIPGGKLPPGLVNEGPKAIAAQVEGFEKAKKFDQMNERRPDF